MPSRLGLHAERLKGVAALRTSKGRRAGGRFAFEGATLLGEAHGAGFPIEEVYATQEAYERTPLVEELEAGGTAVFIVEAASAAKISDVVTPSGIVAVAPMRLASVTEFFEQSAPLLVLADVADPANAGTLLRSADAFGCGGVLFGSLGVEPYHPKVVRGSMGAVFRLALASGEPAETAAAAQAAGMRLLGLSAQGEPLPAEPWRLPTALVVGHERHGLGRWAGVCAGFLGISMRGHSESLSAAVAGSIALYEAAASVCQESTQSPKSQDYRG